MKLNVKKKKKWKVEEMKLQLQAMSTLEEEEYSKYPNFKYQEVLFIKEDMKLK